MNPHHHITFRICSSSPLSDERDITMVSMKHDYQNVSLGRATAAVASGAAQWEIEEGLSWRGFIPVGPFAAMIAYQCLCSHLCRFILQTIFCPTSLEEKQIMATHSKLILLSKENPPMEQTIQNLVRLTDLHHSQVVVMH